MFKTFLRPLWNHYLVVWILGPGILGFIIPWKGFQDWKTWFKEFG